jgi:hypothetical protein
MVAALAALSVVPLHPALGLQPSDDYTRYELLAPTMQSFRIIYDVTATAPGTSRFFNTLRPGSEHTVAGVIDLMSGKALEWTVISGAQAREAGHLSANAGTDYIMIQLPRPVPESGEVRLRIDKTYRDTASYFAAGEEIVFQRSLGIKRNSVVLPPGYELTEVSYPSQVMTEADGRIKVSFMNPGPAAVPYEVRARRLPATTVRRAGAVAAASATVTSSTGPALPPQGAASGVGAPPYPFTERAFQDREIVYFLEQPETHAFRLYHDYTETRPGVDRYVNVVRVGSTVSNPSAVLLDTGERLRVETLRGDAIRQRGVDIGVPVTERSEAVVIWFAAPAAGESRRLRVEETYTDAARYRLEGDELVWDRSFGRSRNRVVLPAGWYLTVSAIPAVVRRTDDGRIQLDFTNDRPDEIRVYLRARRR